MTSPHAGTMRAIIDGAAVVNEAPGKDKPERLWISANPGRPPNEASWVWSTARRLRSAPRSHPGDGGRNDRSEILVAFRAGVQFRLHFRRVVLPRSLIHPHLGVLSLVIVLKGNPYDSVPGAGPFTRDEHRLATLRTDLAVGRCRRFCYRAAGLATPGDGEIKIRSRDGRRVVVPTATERKRGTQAVGKQQACDSAGGACVHCC